MSFHRRREIVANRWVNSVVKNFVNQLRSGRNHRGQFMPKGKKSLQLRLIKEEEAKYLPSFASTNGEIKRAVERNAIARGALLIKVIISLKLDNILEIIRSISKSYDKEEIIQAANDLNIDLTALKILEEANPPIAYPYYFC